MAANSVYRNGLYFLAGLLLCRGGEATAGPAGTTITATKTAIATWRRIEKFQWELSESLQVPNQVTLVIPQGQSSVIGFNLIATRSGPEVLDSETTLSGEVCVRNSGNTPTEGLRIRDHLEQELSPGNWQTIARTTIPVRQELRPGARRCYPYEFTRPLEGASRYRNWAIITIDNYAGHEGEPRSISVVAPLESTIQSTTVDASATLSDPFQCPAGFSCELSGTTNLIQDSTTVPFTALLKNLSAPCGQTLTAADTGTLVPTDTQAAITAHASVSVYTGTCLPNRP